MPILYHQVKKWGIVYNWLKQFSICPEMNVGTAGQVGLGFAQTRPFRSRLPRLFRLKQGQKG